MELFSEKPQPGDIIEIFSIGYKDWAIYMGDGDVIHLTACPGGKAKVTKETLKKAAKGCCYWVNNHQDHEFRSQPMRDIIASAKWLINKRVNYKVCVKNCKKFVNNLRYGQIPRPLSSDNPQPGDLIEISRKVYLHWAVYVGEGYVVHLVGPGMLSSASSYNNDNSIRLFKGKVLRELLEIVVDKDEYRINNSWDNKYRPKPVQEIVRLAEANVGNPRFYQVLLSNCEHFACEMRYGRRHSTQVSPRDARLSLLLLGLCWERRYSSEYISQNYNRMKKLSEILQLKTTFRRALTLSTCISLTDDGKIWLSFLKNQMAECSDL